MIGAPAPMSLLSALYVQQVAVFETFVVPRYLSMFGALALEMLLPCERAVVANLGCRTGYPNEQLAQVLPGCHIVGLDPSPSAIELAVTKSALVHQATVEYRVVEEPPFVFDPGSFSHVLAISPMVAPLRIPELIREMARLLAPGGQALYAMPLRGSFQEIVDLVREYALKTENDGILVALEDGIARRPTPETFSAMFEEAGLVDVDVDMRLVNVPFSSGRDFFEDPATRILVLPELQDMLGSKELVEPLAYVREAVDRYWAECDFELSVNIGCATARQPT